MQTTLIWSDISTTSLTSTHTHIRIYKYIYIIIIYAIFRALARFLARSSSSSHEKHIKNINIYIYKFDIMCVCRPRLLFDARHTLRPLPPTLHCLCPFRTRRGSCGFLFLLESKIEFSCSLATEFRILSSILLLLLLLLFLLLKYVEISKRFLLKELIESFVPRSASASNLAKFLFGLTKCLRNWYHRRSTARPSTTASKWACLRDVWVSPQPTSAWRTVICGNGTGQEISNANPKFKFKRNWRKYRKAGLHILN